MDVNLINDTTEEAYFRLGLGSFIGSYNVGTIDTTTTIAIAPGGTATGLDITYADAGKLLFSLGTVLPDDNPSFQNNSGGDDGWKIRWDKVEMTLLTGTSAVYSTANLSSTDFYALNMEIQTYASPSATTPTNTLTWGESAQELFTQLGSIANNSTDIAVVGTAGSDGVEVPGIGNVLRVIAPSTVPPGSAGPYIAAAEAYLDYAVQQQQSHSIYTAIDDHFDGTVTQNITFEATVEASGTTATDILMIGSVEGVNGMQTIDIPDASTAIVSVNPTFYVNGTAETFNNNDAYAIAVRDILGGFNAGLVDSTAINPNSGTADLTYEQTAAGYGFANTPSPDGWYGLPNGSGFGSAQANVDYYNAFAGIIAENSNSYGFPFSDLLANPPAANINPASTDHINITILGDSLRCFAEGTRIDTRDGGVPIEQLHEGDAVLTISGAEQAIRWIGHRRVDCRRHPHPEEVWPIRIAPHAFGEGLPRRPLLLSRDHAAFVEGVLIPVRHLVNGTTITQCQVDVVTYYHIELPRHDVVLAEGMPTETYLESGSRNAFESAGSVLLLHPIFAVQGHDGFLAWESLGYAPLIGNGEPVDRIRRVLERQAEALRASGNGDWAPARKAS